MKGVNVEELHSYFSLQKFAKHAQGFGSVVNFSLQLFYSSAEIFDKFEISCERIPGHDLLAICSRKCLKSFVIYAHDVLTTFVMFAKSL